MKILGLLGGVASGKSTVAELFRQRGAVVLDADKAGHEVLRMPAVRAAIGGRWGSAVIGADGEIDRAALARIVFAPPPDGPRELAELERITHPEIRKRLKTEAEALARQGTPLVVLDAPVMLKAGWDKLCDALAFVDCPAEQRLARAKERGWSEAEFQRREGAQEPVEEKRRLADFVLDNSGDVSYIRTQVERRWQALLKPEA
ncbi:MAG TPA: dephospho-CoA kinase [Pirellulales bacterium]|nr:dephospho-CoA kinase [Pirellulales bacterium]